MMTSSKHQIFQRTKSIFRKIVLGKLKLTPEHYTEKPILPGNAQNWQRPSPPQIDAVMIERLRTMLSRAGLNPVSDGGLPPLPKPRFNEPLNNTYTDACREFK